MRQERGVTAKTKCMQPIPLPQIADRKAGRCLEGRGGSVGVTILSQQNHKIKLHQAGPRRIAGEK